MSLVLEDVEGLFGTDVKRILEISVSEVQFVVSEADGDITLNAESENNLQLKLFGDHDLVYALLFSGQCPGHWHTDIHQNYILSTNKYCVFGGIGIGYGNLVFWAVFLF